MSEDHHRGCGHSLLLLRPPSAAFCEFVAMRCGAVVRERYKRSARRKTYDVVTDIRKLLLWRVQSCRCAGVGKNGADKMFKTENVAKIVFYYFNRIYYVRPRDFPDIVAVACRMRLALPAYNRVSTIILLLLWPQPVAAVPFITQPARQTNSVCSTIRIIPKTSAYLPTVLYYYYYYANIIVCKCNIKSMCVCVCVYTLWAS